ncbi:hypothetical protein [uncultured Ottowia sp.]|uniref:hypothetical protein n=1 Tax=uncultured Ottowia sp. TaxID=543067 RepID=UPI002594FEFE|nr:hypothetical protein [uncultured Ottowia sp.]
MNILNLIEEGVSLFKNKKFDEAITKLNRALDQIKDKDSQIQKQIDIQFWLGRCYLEQAIKAKERDAEQLFGLAIEHHQQQLRLAKQLEDENGIQEQINAQHLLGQCYFEQAMKAEGEASEQLFGQAVEHNLERLRLAKQLEDKQNNIQKQINAQFSLGRCYFEQAMKAEGEASEQLFGQAVKHHQQQLRLAKQLEDENGIQEQINAQFSLGRCYFEQAMKAEGEASEQLFGQAVEHHQQQLRLAKQLEDKQNNIQEQNNAQSSLGRCYFEQAMKAKGEASTRLFEQAIEHHQQQLRLAEQLEGESGIQKQINAEACLGRCYSEQAIKAKGEASTRLFEQAIKHRKQQLRLAEQLEGENGIQEQINAEAWLGRCYLEQAIKAKGEASTQLFKQAIKHRQQQLRLAKKLEDKQNSIQQQIYAQFRLGRCYLKQAVKIKDEDSSKVKESIVKKSIKEADKCFSFSSNNLSQLKDELKRDRANRIIIQHSREVYFLQEKWQDYFEQKKQKIRKSLFKHKEGNLIDAVSTILAVLNIPPIELGSIPLTHYTSPSVCDKLFGIVYDKNDVNNKNKDPVGEQLANPIRISSSTYMNDPTEGEGLLELLDLQDLELENKVDCPDYNAFFTCFSSRANDLNQFRLYGKENGVEASGCCLVFNKDGNWLKEPDVSVSFRSMAKKGDEYLREQPVEADISDADLEDANLPLYQVAYIAYKDKYLARDKCRIWLPSEDDQKFGIQLEPVGKNSSWYDFRIDELEKALKQLIDFFKEKSNINDEDREALEYIRYPLEYIRYLFKDFAFRDEEEFRLLKIEKIGSDKIEHCETTQSIYLPYADARDIVDEVILGTNYEKSGKGRKAEAFQHLMRKHYPNVKVSRSSLPINANPPIKKD